MRYLLIFSALFFFSPIFSQVTNDSVFSYPFWVESKIPGFERELVMAPRFAGVSAANQIAWKATVDPGDWAQNNNFHSLNPGDTVWLYNRENMLIGFDTVRAGEGRWSPTYRIITTESLQAPYFAYLAEQEKVKQQVAELASVRMQNAQAAYEEERLKAENDREKFNEFLRFLAIGASTIFFILLLIFFYQRRNSPAARRRREETMSQILAARQKQIQLNLENDVPVYLAGEPQVPGGLDPVSAKHRLEYLSGATIVKFAPVRVEFLKPVNIGYAHAYATFQPKATDTTIYYLGETEWGVIVLCAMRCGNSIIGAEGQNLQLGTDFIVVEAVQNEEIKNYLWSSNFVTEKSTAE